MTQEIKVSFEFFPPKTEAMEKTLWDSIQRLAPLGAAFVSVTYGAGGSTRERTHAIVSRILSDTALIPAAHLTCVAATREQVNAVAQAYWDAGVRHIVALRGDPPEGPESGVSYKAHPGGYDQAVDLVAGLKDLHDFEISVGAYPEVHPEAASAQADLDNLKRKIDAGASNAITQFFFDNDAYLRFRDRAVAAGINVPIIPGIMPVLNFTQMQGFAKACGASIPAAFAACFEGLEDEPDTRKMVSTYATANQCEGLRREGVSDFHFYTLNRAELSLAICQILGVRRDSEKAGA